MGYGYDFYYGSSPEIYADQFALVIGVILVAFVLVVYALLFLFLIATYVAESLSIYKLCKKLDIKNAFLGFIPYASTYKFGEIADVLCERNQENTKLRYKKLLLILHIASAVSLSIFLIPYLVIVISLIVLPAEAAMIVEMCAFLVMLALYFVVLGVSITYSVFYFITLYKIFRYTDEKNSSLYFILSIVLMLAASITFAPCIFMLIIAFSKKPIPAPAPVSVQIESEE